MPITQERMVRIIDEAIELHEALWGLMKDIRFAINFATRERGIEGDTSALEHLMSGLLVFLNKDHPQALAAMREKGHFSSKTLQRNRTQTYKQRYRRGKAREDILTPDQQANLAYDEENMRFYDKRFPDQTLDIHGAPPPSKPAPTAEPYIDPDPEPYTLSPNWVRENSTDSEKDNTP